MSQEGPSEADRSSEADGSGESKNWRKLAAEVAQETDPIKLDRLIEELCVAFDERAKPVKEKPSQTQGE